VEGSRGPELSVVKIIRLERTTKRRNEPTLLDVQLAHPTRPDRVEQEEPGLAPPPQVKPVTPQMEVTKHVFRFQTRPKLLQNGFIRIYSIHNYKYPLNEYISLILETICYMSPDIEK
jgi:hypothetical protein